MILQILISILFGLIPEVLFFTLFITCAKGIKKKRIKLFLLMSIAYIICMFIKRYEVFYYCLFVVLIYIILKILYGNKTQIIDIFIINLGFNYVCITSYICFLFLEKDLSNYYYLYIIERIILFCIFIFRKSFNSLYKKYCALWNRNDNIKRPIKSITLRNISLITLNIGIVLMDLACIYILSL